MAEREVSDRVIASEPAWRLRDGELSPAEAPVIGEEPLEILVDGVRCGIVMRTPGDDLALVAGFCLAEGLIEAREDLGSIQACEQEEANQVSVVRVGAAGAGAGPAIGPRMVASSCGLCGRAMIDDMLARLPQISDRFQVSTAELLAMGRRLRQAQQLFRPTGGTHAAGLFDAAGELISIGEDVGRHNALDKAVGRLLLAGRLEEAKTALLSGRCSFEMVQKAARAGIGVVASVSAPTKLAVELARAAAVALVGFVREETLTIYADCGRIADLPVL